MTNDVLPNRCPGCGAEVPAEAPQGLCPKCLLAGVAQATEPAPTVRVEGGRPSIEVVAAAFPQLEIIEWVGEGGMGVVFKARQPKLDRLVALKVLPQGLAGDAAFRERFTREGRVLARLNHPNIVAVHDFGEAGGFFYLLMEYVDGANLRQAMRAGRFTPGQALEIVPKVCEALQYAHGEGILHRDIKPENILLDQKGRVKIADFGIAKLMGNRAEAGTLTATGATVGTPQYMAPEQLEHPQDVDHRADIYSLGVVFYEMLTGELPLGRFAPPSAKTPVDTRVDEVVFRALEKEREKRFQSAGAVKTEVEDIVSEGAHGMAVPPELGGDPTSSGGRLSGGLGRGRKGGAEGGPPIRQASGPAIEDGAGSPPRIKPEHRPLVLLGLAVLLVLLMMRLLPLPAILIGIVAGMFQGGVLPALGHVLSLAAGGGVMGAAWVYRRRLLEPLGIAASEMDTGMTASFWASPRILGTVAVAVLMAVSVLVAFEIVLLGSALLGFIRGFAWPTRIGLAIGVAVAWRLVRSHATAVGSASAGLPLWQRRAAVVFLALGGLVLLISVAHTGYGVGYWQLDALVAVTGVALLTRSRAWRVAAVAINSVQASLGAAQVLSLVLVLGHDHAAQFGTAVGVVGPAAACAMSMVETLVFTAGLVVLCRSGAGGAATEGHPPAVSSLATGPVPVRFSRSAVWSAVLVGISLVGVLVGLAVAALGVWVVRVDGGGGSLKLGLVVLGLAVLGTATVGTALGAVGWIEVNRSGGQLRGKVLAVLGALTWPVLVLLLGPLVLLSVGHLTVSARDQVSASFPPAPQQGWLVADGVVREYRIPAGQVAVFEVVTQLGSDLVTLPGCGAYALAPAERSADATVDLDPRLPNRGSPSVGLWQFRVSSGGSVVATGFDLPSTVTAPVPFSSASVTLEPESERVEWIVPGDGRTAALGVRIRTCPHGLAGIEPGDSGSLGQGTNWIRGSIKGD